MSPVNSLKSSLFELKKIYSLAAIAMLLALRIVLGMFANATLPFFGNAIKISGAFLPIVLAGALFGPIPAMLVGALGDVLSYVIAPTAGGFFPGFTISGALTGLIYGFAFYKQKITFPRVIIAWMINTLIVETFLAAYWLFVIYMASSDKSYMAWLIARLIGQGVKCVPEILLIFGVGKLSDMLQVSLGKKFKS